MPGLVRYMPHIPLGEFVDYLYVDKHADSLLAPREFLRPTHPLMAIGNQPTGDFSQSAQLKGIFTQALPKNATYSLEHVIGIRFKPYGLFTGFGIPGDFTANRILPASLVFSQTDVLNIAELLQDKADQAAIEYVHQVLYNKLEPRNLLYEIVEMLDALVETDLSKNSQRDLAKAFERSPKSFIEVFRKAIGTTPLSYLHIHKIDTARQIMREQPAIPLTEIGYQLGFYDQAHFIRVFKKHTAFTPLQYKAALQPQVNSVQL